MTSDDGRRTTTPIARHIRRSRHPMPPVTVWFATAGTQERWCCCPLGDSGGDRVVAMDERIARLERQVELVKYPMVRGGEVLAPVGVISDFLEHLPSVVLERARRDCLPIPARANREGYCGNDHATYWVSGLMDYDKVLAACDRLGISRGRYYDFGGSTGRLFRHFYSQNSDFEVWSSDFKTASFEWNQQHMPIDVRVFVNGFAPPLPIPDAHVEVVTALSVFTHIDELEFPWLMELRRIIKPGGLLYATIHDETTWENKSKSLVKAIKKSDNGASVSASSPFPGQRTAFHFTESSYYSCNVFHPTGYIRGQWGRFFDIIEIMPSAHGAQSVVLLTPH